MALILRETSVLLSISYVPYLGYFISYVGKKILLTIFGVNFLGLPMYGAKNFVGEGFSKILADGGASHTPPISGNPENYESYNLM